MRLIELIIVMAIIGIGAGSFALPLVTGLDAWNMLQFRQDVLGSAQAALDRMVRDLTYALDDNVFEAPAWNDMRLTTLADGWQEAVTYYYDEDIAGGGARKRILRNTSVLLGAGPNDRLVIRVDSFSVTYYGLNNNVLAVPIQPASVDPPLQVWRIHLAMTVSEAGRTVSLEEDAYPRSFNRALRGADVYVPP